MDIQQAKKKLTIINKSIATKHPKVLVSELCGIVKFLLDEIERIKSPPTTLLQQLPVGENPPEPVDRRPDPMPPPSLPDKSYIPPTTTDRPIVDLPTCFDNSSEEK